MPGSEQQSAPRLLSRQWVAAGRRYVEQSADRAWVATRGRFDRRPPIAPFDAVVRYALVTVNASTTHYLKLMLCTLAEQSNLGIVQRIVIVDNRSRDGGVPFLRSLTERAPRVHLVENRVFLNHARGIRAGLRALARIERDLPAAERANVLLFVDSDVIFRSPTALHDLTATIMAFDAVLVGEVRHMGDNPHPNIQASFFALRRDVTARRDITPWINSGDPAFDLQWSIVKAGLPIVDFPSNRMGHILHRGRSASVAAARFTPLRSYGTVPRAQPHFMNVPDGARIWDEIEARHASRLLPATEPALVDSLATSFARLGNPTDHLT